MSINVDAFLFYGITIYSADSGEPAVWPEGICRDEDNNPDPECEPDVSALEKWLTANGHDGIKVGSWGHVNQQDIYLYTTQIHAWDDHPEAVSLSKLGAHDTDAARLKLVRALKGLGFSVDCGDNPEATFPLEAIGWWLTAYSDYS